jgi:multiple sugar transport system substrate-binding protein
MAWEDLLYTEVIIPQYEKANPNVEVKFYRYENYWDKLTVLFAGGEAPDVMRNYIPFIGRHVRLGIPAPLDDYIKSDRMNLKEFTPIPFETLSFLDHVYMLPAGINSHNVLYYNKDLFDKAGVKYPNPDWTWADLETAAKTLTKGGQSGFLWAIPSYLFYSTVANLGGKVWDKSKEKCIIDNPEAVKAIKMIQGWIFDSKISPKVGATQLRTSSYAMFMGGRLAMITEGGWACPEFKRDAPKLNFARTTIPRANAQSLPLNSAMGTGWILNSKTKYPKESWKLLSSLVSHDGLLTYWRQSWVEVPARKSVLEDPKFHDVIGIGDKVPGIKTEQEFKEKAQPLVDIVTNGWFNQEVAAPYFDILDSKVEQALGQLIGVTRGNPEQVLKKLAADVNDAISKEKR